MLDEFDFLRRFLEKISINNNCWVWQAGKSKEGYARIKFKGTTKYAHRVIFEYYYGKIDKELTVDHLCKNKSCVNPQHLEAVSLKENLVRASHQQSTINSNKTHCKRGHKLSNDNLYIQSNSNKRGCIECRRLRQNTNYYKNLQRSRNYHRDYKRKKVLEKAGIEPNVSLQ